MYIYIYIYIYICQSLMRISAAAMLVKITGEIYSELSACVAFGTRSFCSEFSAMCFARSPRNTI